MGNKEGKQPVFEDVPEEEWEKEDHESTPETMTMLNRTLQEMPPKVKAAMEKAGVTDAEIKENVHVAFTVSYFNFRKEYGEFQIAEKKGKCPQCPKENLLKASMCDSLLLNTESATRSSSRETHSCPNETTRQGLNGVLRQGVLPIAACSQLTRVVGLAQCSQ